MLMSPMASCGRNFPKAKVIFDESLLPLYSGILKNKHLITSDVRGTNGDWAATPDGVN